MHKGGFCLKKIFILDTNVLIQEPGAFENFEDNLVVIPLIVVEELDGLKKADGEKGSENRCESIDDDIFCLQSGTQ